MTSLVVNVLVSMHRALFTAAVALLGVGGSLLAEDPRSAQNWLAVIGPALVVYLADFCGSIEADARILATGPTMKPYREIRMSAFRKRHRGVFFGVCVVVVACLISWLVFAFDDNSSAESEPRARTPLVVCVQKTSSSPVYCRADGHPVSVTLKR